MIDNSFFVLKKLLTRIIFGAKDFGKKNLGELFKGELLKWSNIEFLKHFCIYIIPKNLIMWDKSSLINVIIFCFGVNIFYICL